MFEVDPNGAVAPYEQIRVQVIEAVRSGDLVPGSRMPTVRRLAEELGLAANTVARAYRELEHDGVIETRGRNGSFVSATGDPTRQQAQLAASDYADRVGRLGVDAEDALAMVRSALGLPAGRG